MHGVAANDTVVAAPFIQKKAIAHILQPQSTEVQSSVICANTISEMLLQTATDVGRIHNLRTQAEKMRVRGHHSSQLHTRL